MTTIRLAEPDDSETIVRILREGLGGNLSAYTIADSFGMTEFVRDQLTSHELGVSRYFVSEENEEIVGFAEFRLLKNEIFLNNIYVKAQVRGTGSGKALLNAGLDLAKKRGLKKIGLDVFSENFQAKSWYEKLGFAVVSEYAWLVLEIISDSNSCYDYKVLNKPFADCVFRRFGFASLDIETTSGMYPVGLLGDHFFRVNTACILNDKEALSCLTRLGSTRKILYIDNVLNIHEMEANTNTKVASNFRMSADIMTALASME